ncbi:MAG: ATP-dependent RNA helicase HrpA, partial [Proteobacteria bacterium]
MHDPALTSLPTLESLRERLALVRHADAPRLTRELARLARRPAGRVPAGALKGLEKAIEASIATVERLRSLPLRLEFDAALPITAHREEIATALARHQVIVVCGATGSGKTTQLPKICLEAGRGAQGLIGHTQPRRIAARAIAARLAADLGTPLGGAVGYQVRFNERLGPDSRVKLMTDGILLRELEHDRTLRRYDTLIIDEAHERSLNIDFLLGVLKRILPERPELRVIVTSATIDPQRFAAFFGASAAGEVPVIEVSGRSYPVEVRYRPLSVPQGPEGEPEEELTLAEGVVAAVQELDRDSRGMRGDVLVFLPGEKQIREAAEVLGKARLGNTEVLPLYARLSTRDQERIFEPHAARRVVLATNVAETSLTVPGIRFVVDSGLARISRYSVRGKVQRLPIEPISRASADQRKGRCGRESEGICIRLFSEEDFELRPEFTPPEILRTNLASVILRMAALGLGDPQAFPFIDPPDTRLINDGYRLLQELKAVDAERRVTSLGAQLASMPLDPKLARMLVAASHHGCLREMLVVAAFLASQDPRERPSEAQQQADEKHALFADPRSDFVTVLNLWKAFCEQSAALSRSRLRKWCREHFLSYLRLREWQELHAQLTQIAAELELRANETEASYADLHQAILSGFLGGIGSLEQKREYLGARGTRFTIAPGTPLASRPPRWIVAANLVETTRLYARMVAAVEPQWIEAVGAHLVKRSYSEPHWVEARGFVAAYESTALYGLTLAARRRVNYGSVAPDEAREIFVREALVEGRTRLRARFLEHNRRLRARIEYLEAKLRRKDVLVDDEALCRFYLERLPAHIHSVAALERWLKREPEQADALCASLGDFMRREVSEVTDASHPDALDIGGNRLPLEYRFEPGAEDDGVTLVVPEPLLGTLDEGRLAWLIPGWRAEKIAALLRALPKALRKAFVPVPDHAAAALARLDPDADFHAQLAAWVTQGAGQTVTAEQIAALPLPDHLRMNFRVTDARGKVLARGRDLLRLRRALRARREQEAGAPAAQHTHRAWDFGELPPQRAVERRGLKFVVYPSIRDRGDGVQPVEAGSEVEAQALLRRGVLRLAVLALPEQYKYARKAFASNRDLMLLGQGFATSKPLADALAEHAFVECFLRDEPDLPRTATQFQALLDRRRSDFGEVVDKLAAYAVDVLRELRAVRQALSQLEAPVFASAVADARAHLDALVPAGFPAAVPPLLWPHLPRYLKALSRRVAKLGGNVARDTQLARRVAPFAQACAQLGAGVRGDEVRPEYER